MGKRNLVPYALSGWHRWQLSGLCLQRGLLTGIEKIFRIALLVIKTRMMLRPSLVELSSANNRIFEGVRLMTVRSAQEWSYDQGWGSPVQGRDTRCCWQVDP